MTRLDETTVHAPLRGWRRAARALGAVLGGAAAAWLAAQFLAVVVALRPDVEELSLSGLASAVVAGGALAGIALTPLTPVAAVLAAAARRIPGGGAVACALVGAGGGAALALLLGTNTLAVALPGAAVGAVCGLAGWAGARWASGSAVRTSVLVVAASALYAGAYVVTVSGSGV